MDSVKVNKGSGLFELRPEPLNARLEFKCNCRARAQRIGARARNLIEATMTDYQFDPDRLDVFRLSTEYV